MPFMESLHFSRRPDRAPDGLFGRPRPHCLPADQPLRSAHPPADRAPPAPLTPAELRQVARGWKRRGDAQSLRVAQALEALAAQREPLPEAPAAFLQPRPPSVVRRISEFMGL